MSAISSSSSVACIRYTHKHLNVYLDTRVLATSGLVWYVFVSWVYICLVLWLKKFDVACYANVQQTQNLSYFCLESLLNSFILPRLEVYFNSIHPFANVDTYALYRLFCMRFILSLLFLGCLGMALFDMQIFIYFLLPSICSPSCFPLSNFFLFVEVRHVPLDPLWLGDFFFWIFCKSIEVVLAFCPVKT